MRSLFSPKGRVHVPAIPFRCIEHHFEAGFSDLPHRHTIFSAGATAPCSSRITVLRSLRSRLESEPHGASYLENWLCQAAFDSWRSRCRALQGRYLPLVFSTRSTMCCAERATVARPQLTVRFQRFSPPIGPGLFTPRRLSVRHGSSSHQIGEFL